MDKKEMKQIRIIEVIRNQLSSSQDYSGEWTSNIDIDFVIDKPQSVQIFNKSYVIDRIKMVTLYDEIVFRLATSDTHFEELEVSKIFIHKIYDSLNHLQSEGNILSGWELREEVFEILCDKKPSYSLNYR